MSELAGVIDRPSIQPMRGTEGSPIIGPKNPAREAQNVDRLAPPKTVHGTLISKCMGFWVLIYVPRQNELFQNIKIHRALIPIYNLTEGDPIAFYKSILHCLFSCFWLPY
jgi:hypothetical protein